MLEAAGWRLRNAEDDVRSRDGRRFEFGLLVPEEAPAFHPVALAVREQLAEVGVAVRLEFAPFEECLKRLKERHFEAYAGSVICNSHPSLDKLRWQSDGPLDYGGYGNEVVDQLFEQAQRTADPDRQRELYTRIQQLIYDDQPCMFLWWKPTLWAFHKRVRGVHLSPRGPTLFYPGIRSWWILAGNS